MYRSIIKMRVCKKVVLFFAGLLLSFLCMACTDGGRTDGKKGESYINAELLEVQEEQLVVKPIDNADTCAPEEIKEAEELTLDLTGFEFPQMPEELAVGAYIRVVFNEDSFLDGEHPELGIVFGIYLLDEAGEVVPQ